MIHTDELGGFQLLEIRSSLPDELLMYADKLSMAHSLEVRVPYLDRTVVEYVQRLGAGFKVRNGSRKWLHRRVCEHYLPSHILKRKKRGFAVNVVDDWFHSSLNGELQEVLLDKGSLMFGLLKPKPVRKLLSDHRSGETRQPQASLQPGDARAMVASELLLYETVVVCKSDNRPIMKFPEYIVS